MPRKCVRLATTGISVAFDTRICEMGACMRDGVCKGISSKKIKLVGLRTEAKRETSLN